MNGAIETVDLAARLIACPSVTPEEAGAMDVLGDVLAGLGFAVDRFRSGGSQGPWVENMVAIRGKGRPHFAFAGHVDVVPGGEGWTGEPFVPVVRGGFLYGRGAVDMKGAIAAFVGAAAAAAGHKGTLSLLITGDEEGPAVHGTRAIMDWMAERRMKPDMILVGEPTSEAELGDTIKIGRRGSVNIWIAIPGVQGHVAYPHLADNPITRLGPLLTALEAVDLDGGSRWFQPSNLEVTEVAAGENACNVIPASARVRLNIRFNDLQRGESLVARVRKLVEEIAPGSNVEAIISGEAFVTPPGPLTDLLRRAIEAETGRDPMLSTGGGTSDARFLSQLCPVAEFGLVSATMHKADEAVAIDDLERLQRIYARIIREALGRV